MAAEAKEFESKHEITVHGYVRENFDNNYWINEIIQIIVQFYMSNGQFLYVWGNDGSTENKCKSPILCPNFQGTIVDLSIGYYGPSLVLDLFGDVWTWENAEYGILENGKVIDSSTPQRLSVMGTVIGIAAGGNHSLILLKNGCVLSFGDGSEGQLGHGNTEAVLTPKTIEALKSEKIIQIAAGYEHSVCLSNKGVVFCFGYNLYGECGVGRDDVDEILIPTKIEFDEYETDFEVFVVCIECGDSMTLLIDNNASIYSCGRGDYGMLGHGDVVDRYEPTLIEDLAEKNIIKCSSGAYHSMCIDHEGIAWSFGENDKAQCGLPSDIEQQLAPAKIEYFVENNVKAVYCSAGYNHSCIISSDGSLYVFGSNEDYQLGLEEKRCFYEPKKLTLPKAISVKKVSAGFEFTAVIFN